MLTSFFKPSMIVRIWLVNKQVKENLMVLQAVELSSSISSYSLSLPQSPGISNACKFHKG